MKRVILLGVFMLSSAVCFASVDGRKTVTSAGTAEALSATATTFGILTVCAETDNTGIIAIGYGPVAALATRTGVPLSASDCYSISYIGTSKRGLLNEIYIDSTVSGDGVTYSLTTA